MDEKDAQEIGYLMMAAAGIIAAERVWSLHVRPWLGQYVNLDAHNGGDVLLTLGRQRWTVADAVGIGVMVVGVLALVAVLRRLLRRRRARRAYERERQQTRPGGAVAGTGGYNPEDWE